MLPTAHAVALWHYRDLLRNLIARDLRVKYKGSALGIGWSLLHPLVMMAVYTLAFRYIARVPIAHFPVFFLSGLLPWTFLSSSLAQATGSVGDSGALVRKVAFPRAILPLAAVGSNFVQLLVAYPLVVVLALAIGPGLTPAALAVVPIALLQLAFTAGVALILATAYVHFRDARHLVDVWLQIWFWLTPIAYSLSLAPDRIRRWLLMNPMTWFATAYQDAIVHQEVPGLERWLLLGGVTLLSVAGGAWLFRRHEPRFAELV